MAENGTKFLDEMLDRLYAALSGGPNLNCRPHSSRQRLDFHAIARLGDLPAEDVLVHLFLEGTATIIAKEPDRPVEPTEETAEPSSSSRVDPRQSVLNKLRTIAEDALTFEQDTGAHVLHLGFPLLNLPPGQLAAGRKGSAKRVLAPLAFVPVHLKVLKGRTAKIELNAAGDKADRVLANTALFTWIERQTGKAAALAEEPSDDPYRDINALIAYVSDALSLPSQPEFSPSTALIGSPRADREEASAAQILPAAVLGLFPFSNQGLIDDMEAFLAGEPLPGPAPAFVRVGSSEIPPPAREPAPLSPPTGFAEDRLIAPADPCQARTVRLARQAEILVVHGPPGTGKSQTIVNMIGDHLARGQRVLLVCDKRIALDVVYYRLDRLGLGQLCAVVHDAHSDQREFYRGVREQIENLTETAADEAAAGKLTRANNELQKLHDELTQYTTALTAKPDAATPSLHELMGAWLAIPAPTSEADGRHIALEDGETHEKAIREIFQRGQDCGYAINPWTTAVGCSLTAFLAQPMDHWRQVLAALGETVGRADETRDEAIMPFPEEGDVTAVGRERAAFGETLGRLFATVDVERLTHWAGQTPARARQAKTNLDGQERNLRSLREEPLDPELMPFHKEEPLTNARIAPWLMTLDAYLKSAASWYGFLYFGRKTAAATILRRFGLPVNAANAARLKTFLLGVRARLALLDCHDSSLAAAPLANRFDDATLRKALDDHAAILTALEQLDSAPVLMPLAASVREAMREPAQREAVSRGLERAAPRAIAIAEMQSRLAETGLFAPGWLNQVRRQSRDGKPFAPVVADLTAWLGKLEGVLRVRHDLAQLTPPLTEAIGKVLGQGLSTEESWNVWHKSLLAAEIARRLRDLPFLQTVDGDKLRASFERYRLLDERRKGLAGASGLAFWIGRQRERLLVGTGSRLNSVGAELGRRFLLRGKRAMRLRQVIKNGADIADGDPLFDLRPVWMAGPSAVAELFPRIPLFDLVIFDEASQCRLEEALPVLTRGKRVVIAGDPQQLPPTRFFESALAVSEEEEPQTDQELFESQQSHMDDLLGAALNLPVERSYLDVHYRSHNADLIEFSNRNFYEARLQPIPGHPANKPFQAPVRLHRVNGTYDKHTNPAEAAYIVKIVRELLRRAEPPSIGIACFNISQRNEIVDALDAAAAEDAEFARRLAEARVRQGTGSFEGLFVRNLENVQGDERDYLLVSTTYGPDPSGKFYRRFGPLARAGGGRRLNVLVTRAREEVHLVTSIPAAVYRALPPVPPGTVPNGGWLLFAYLNYAEELEKFYEEQRLAHQEKRKPGEVLARPTQLTSSFARALANQLARQHGLSSTLDWGNDGFCVDIALHHPTQPDNVTIGILCDGCRFRKTNDPVEWDVFRTAVLESQGWKLHRLWTPHFIRDPQAAIESILAAARKESHPPT